MKYDCSWKKKGKNYCIFNLRNESEEVKDPDFHTAMEKMYDLLFDLYEDGEAVVCIDKKLPRNLIPSKFTQLSYFSVNESAWASIEYNTLMDTLKTDPGPRGKLKIDKWLEHPEGGQTYYTQGRCPTCNRQMGSRSDKELKIVENLDKLNGAIIRGLHLKIFSEDFLNLLPKECRDKIKTRRVSHTGKRVFLELLDIETKLEGVPIKEPKEDWKVYSNHCNDCDYHNTFYSTSNDIFWAFPLSGMLDNPPSCLSIAHGTLPPRDLIISSKIWESIKDNKIVKTFEHSRVYFAPEDEIVE